MQLTEQYRPKQWTDVVGQKKAVDKLQTVIKRGLGGRAIFISGQSGTGKTTLALLLGAEIADPDFVTEIDATDLRPAKLKQIEASMNLYSWGRGGRAYIVNEVHGLGTQTIRQLLVMLERIPSHCLWVFTTTCEGKELLFDNSEDTSPLLSRCTRIELARRDLAKPFAMRAREIACKEGLNGQPMEKYLRLVRDKRNNLRAVLQEIESGSMLE